MSNIKLLCVKQGDTQTFVPYRDSILTWLLKDNLGKFIVFLKELQYILFTSTTTVQVILNVGVMLGKRGAHLT